MGESKLYDVGIVGAGAAGLTASIYASRFHLTNIVFGELWGGEIANASIIENYPGFISITGAELTQKMLQHAQSYGVEIKPARIADIRKNGKLFELVTDGGEVTTAKTVILTMGTRRRKLGVSGEEKLAGRGVSYCATCDAAFFKEKVTAVVGGGDAAMTAALHLAQFSPLVYMIVRGPALKGEPIWREKVQANPQIKPLFNTNILEILGEQTVTGVKLSQPYEGSVELKLDGVFVEIGADPDTELAQKMGIELDEGGFIKVSETMGTNLPGVFAAGDITNGNSHLDQIISAEAEAGLAARSAFYLLGEMAPEKAPTT